MRKREMRKSVIFRSIMVGLICFMLLGCDIFGSESSPKDDMEDLTIEPNFSFETVRPVEIKITFYSRESIPIPYIYFQIYDTDPEAGGKLISQGATDSNGFYKTEINLPTAQNQVILIGFLSSYNLDIIDDKVEFEIGGSPEFRTTNHQVSNDRDFTYLDSYDENGVPDNLSVDFVAPGLYRKLDYLFPQYIDIEEAHPEYFLQSNNIIINQSTEIWITFIQEGSENNNSFGFYTYDISSGLPIDAESLEHKIILPNVSKAENGLFAGDKVNLGIFTPGTVIGWFIVEDGWNGSAVSATDRRYYSDKIYNPETTFDQKQHSILLAEGDNEHYYLTFEDELRSNGDDDFNEAVFMITGEVGAINSSGIYSLNEADDTDSDGINDFRDDFPNDYERAFINYYPAENIFGTLAFEEDWPNLGDFDFNDLILGYNFRNNHTADNRLIDIIGTIRLKAIGTENHNGFALELPVSSGNLADWAGDINLETNTPNLILNFFDNAHDIMNPPGEGYVNTKESMELFVSRDINFGISLSSPIPLQSLDYQIPYNPFLRFGGDHSKEIHLADYEPTGNANTNLFGTADDGTNPGDDIFYKSKTSLPWALNFPISFYYTKEKSQVSWGYKNFKDWAESSGMVEQEWYKFLTENTKESHIYIP